VIIPVLNSYVGNTLVYLAGAHPNAYYGLHILDAIGIKIPRLLQSGLRLSTMLVKGV